MNESDPPGLGVGHVHGDAVRHADGQEDAWRGGCVPVPALPNNPTIRDGVVPADLRPMDLA